MRCPECDYDLGEISPPDWYGILISIGQPRGICQVVHGRKQGRDGAVDEGGRLLALLRRSPDDQGPDV